MRVITSSLRNQLFAAFAAVIVVFGIGVVVAIAHLGSVSHTLQNGTERVKMADTLSKDTYNMQGSQLMATLNNGASAGDHEGDVQNFAQELAGPEAPYDHGGGPQRLFRHPAGLRRLEGP